MIRVAHVDADLVELTDRQVAQLVPVVGAVPADRNAAIAGQDQVVGVRRIDPERVVVQVDSGGRVGGEVPSAVGRAKQAGAAEVEPLGVVGIDPDLTVVHGAVVGRGQMLPRLAAVGRTIDAVLRVAAAAAAKALAGDAGVRLDERVDQVAVPAVDVEPDPSLVAFRQALGQLGPRVAAVRRAMDSAARTPAIESPGPPPALVRGREESARVARIHHQFGRAGVVVDEEHALPCLAAVGGAVHAPLGVRTPETSDRRHVRHVGIARMDLDPRDMVRVFQPQMRPRAPGVRGPVHPVAPRRTLPVVRFAGPHPDHVRVRRRHRHVAHRRGRFVPEDVRERDSGVLGLPHATGCDRHIEGPRVVLDDREVRDAPPHDRGADRAKLQRASGLPSGVGRGVLGVCGVRR